VSRRDRTLLGAALAGIAALALVVLLVWDRGGGGGSGATAEAIEARTALTPRQVDFGDTVTASLEVTLDPSRVDPDSVDVKAVFSPWRLVGSPELLRRDGETTSLRTTYVLRCLTNACVSTGDIERIFNEFPEATVAYAPPSGAATGARQTLRVPWPRFLVTARFTQRAAQSGGRTPWLANLDTFPATSYRMEPGRLLALLLAICILLAIAGGALAYLARPRRARRAQPPPERPQRVLTPLQQALALLEDSARVNGTGDQRRALELVAWALAERGDRTLARTARALAWSAPVPGVQETGGVAARARTALGEERDASPE
jgi:hypothetical protein